MTTRETAHSPLELFLHGDELMKINKANYSSTPIAKVYQGEMAVAKSILKCVNNHNLLVEALSGLLADISDYQTINNLGGENNHSQVRAREALKSAGEL